MVESITLANFKGFGVRQTVPLAPITILVGPNNSGKSNFLSVGQFVSRCVFQNIPWNVLSAVGGAEAIFHRPPVGDATATIGWTCGGGEYSVTLISSVPGQFSNVTERLSLADKTVWNPSVHDGHNAFEGLRMETKAATQPYQAVYEPLLKSRCVQLSLDALRSDAKVVPSPPLYTNGAGLAAVVAQWRGLSYDKSGQLDSFLSRCVPEIEKILAGPSPTEGHQRLFVRQRDGQTFDARHVSDGVLCFIALAMHAIDAGPDSLIFIEEPEQSMHPPRIHQFVELLREMVHTRRSQFVIATHSRVLIDEFKDEPEAILRFRRSDEGTRVERVSDLPDLLEALQRSTPGDLVETNLFNAISSIAR